MTLVPYLNTSEELKTKPTQHSVAELRSRGILPEVIVVRSDRPVDASARRKISLFCDVAPDAVINAVDVPNIYAVPLALHEAGLDDVVCRELNLDPPPAELAEWGQMVNEMTTPESDVTIVKQLLQDNLFTRCYGYFMFLGEEEGGKQQNSCKCKELFSDSFHCLKCLMVFK